MPARPHIVLVSREVWPFVTGGGLGRAVRDTAIALLPEYDVTIVTGREHEPAWERLRAETGTWLADPALRFAWIDAMPGDVRPFASVLHAWSDAVLHALVAIAGQRPIDLVEFPDYVGEGAVSLVARAAEPALHSVPMVVRLHTSWELAMALDDVAADDLGGRVTLALERTALTLAELLLSPSPSTTRAVGRAYGPDALPEAIEVPFGFVATDPHPDALRPPAHEGLALLYLGRLELRKGVAELVRAVRASARSDITLTLLGGDTDSAPAGGSMREHLERLAAGDPRISFRGHVPPEEVAAVIREHDVVVAPSRFESFGYIAREANAENRPVLATPVGGLADAVQDGVNGWLTADTTPAALAAAIDDLASRREDVARLIEEGRPRASAEALPGLGAVRAAYAEVIERARGALGTPAAAAAHPPVVALVAALAGGPALAATVRSLAAQEHPGLRIVVAADEPWRVPAAVLDEISDVVYAGDDDGAPLTAARRAALHLVPRDAALVLLRAGDVLEPGFLERALDALAADPHAAYVTAYAAGSVGGRAPLGNLGGRLVPELDLSATVAVLRPGELAAGPPPPVESGGDDAALYAELAAAGRYGIVIAAPLVAVHHAGRARRTARRPATAFAAGRAVWEER